MKRMRPLFYALITVCIQELRTSYCVAPLALEAGYRFLPLINKPTWHSSTLLARYLGPRAHTFVLVQRDSSKRSQLRCSTFWIFTKTKQYSLREEFRRIVQHITLGPLYELNGYRDKRFFEKYATDQFCALIARQLQKKQSELQIVVEKPSEWRIIDYLDDSHYTTITPENREKYGAHSNIILEPYLSDRIMLAKLSTRGERWLKPSKRHIQELRYSWQELIDEVEQGQVLALSLDPKQSYELRRKIKQEETRTKKIERLQAFMCGHGGAALENPWM